LAKGLDTSAREVTFALSFGSKSFEECNFLETRLEHVEVGKMRLLLVSGVVLASVAWSVAAEKPRVYVTDSKSWELGGAVGGTADGFGGGCSRRGPSADGGNH
jgi:hypothetical protein